MVEKAKRLGIAFLFATVTTLIVAACAETSNSSSQSEQAARDATAECGLRTQYQYSDVSFRNDTDATIILRVLPSSWSCNDYKAGMTPDLLDGTTVLPATVSNATALGPPAQDFDTSNDERMARFELSFYTPNSNGRGTQIVTFGPDSTIGFSWDLFTVPGYIDYNEWRAFIGRTGPKWNGVENSLIAYLPDGRPIDLTWNCNRGDIKLRASLRTTG